MTNKVRLMVNGSIYIPMTFEECYRIGYGFHEFQVVDSLPDGGLIDITNHIENFERDDQFGTYYRAYAVVEDGDISFFAVEDKSDDE